MLKTILSKKAVKIAVAAVAALAVLIGGVLLVTKELIPAGTYRQAVALTEAGEYAKAYTLFYSLGDYRDAEQRLADFAVMYDTYTVTSVETGKVSTYRYTYDDHGNLLEKRITVDGKETVQKYTYDERLNEIYYTSGNEDGFDMTEDTAYTYDENGNILTAITTDLYSGVDRITYAYDSQGHLIKATKIARDGHVDERAYFYDAQGNRTEVVHGDIRFFYDENGNLTKETITNDGKTTTCTYTYDERGRLLSMVSDSSDAAITCVYDSKGQLLKREYIGSIPSPKTEYTYNREGQVVKAIQSINGVTEYTFTYDKHGNVVTETAVTDKTEVCHYAYDDCGNLIKKANSLEILEVSGRRIFLRDNSKAALPFGRDNTQEFDKHLYVNDVLTSAYT